MTAHAAGHGDGRRLNAVLAGVRAGAVDDLAIPDPREVRFPAGNRRKLIDLGNDAFGMWLAGRLDLYTHSAIQRRIDAALVTAR